MTRREIYPQRQAARPVVLAAGGTGGHLFPAEALARELLDRGIPAALITDRRGRAFGGSLSEVPVHRIDAATLGAGLVGKLRGTALLGLGLVQSLWLLRRLRPAAVVGFGGYPSLPTVVAARLLGIPVMLHEQNAVLGRANRLVAGGARRIAISFPEVSAVSVELRGRLVTTGNPARPEFAAARDCPYSAFNDARGTLRLLILGGSQGARVFSEVVPEAVAALPLDLRLRLSISQQCRPEDLAMVRAAYDRVGVIDVDLSAFFRDVPQRLAACHLAICRAGASTVAELTTVGRPAILVPYPYAMDDHQTANAKALVAAGAAWLVPQPEFTPAALAACLVALFAHVDELAHAAAAARAWGRVDAAARLADAVTGLLPDMRIAAGAGSVEFQVADRADISFDDEQALVLGIPLTVGDAVR
ncbi:UDP-N-acetylglucosamine--N-acetylmuramyl-(pentapeptide) pyrophosphoryl-undecaprenol N-acetylglucosamine transferase [uncultured Gammaproteobacteria bacterium]